MGAGASGISIAKYRYLASLAEECERWDEMCTLMLALANSPGAANVAGEKERAMFGTAFKNSIGQRRAAWRMTVSTVTKLEAEGDAGKANKVFAEEYLKTITQEMQDICNRLFGTLNTVLIPGAPSAEAKAFFQAMAGDYWRYVAEFSTGEPKTQAAEEARIAYIDATKAAGDLHVTNAVRLGLALNFSVFQYEVLGNTVEACQMARTAFENAIAELDNVEEDEYKDSTLIMQLLRDNLTRWVTDDEAKDAPGDEPGE